MMQKYLKKVLVFSVFFSGDFFAHYLRCVTDYRAMDLLNSNPLFASKKGIEKLAVE